MKLTERISRDGITIDSELLDGPPTGEADQSPDRQWYQVTLELTGVHGSGTFELPFSPSFGDEPTVADVLSLVLMGVRAVQDTRDYEDWCDEWGFDPGDERKPGMYEDWRRIRRELRAFLGIEYGRYLDETEDDT
jgi:hypothetical protein